MKWCYPGSVSCGASVNSAGLVRKFIEREKRPLTLYEAGVGRGFSASIFMKNHNVSMQGCDVMLYDSVKELMQEYPGRLSVEEATLYDSLKRLDDESIDIFYADNVFEHLFPDELPGIMKELARTLKHGALLFLFIPNRFVGPNDVSVYFLKMGQKAEGFHFMEMSYKEVTDVFGKYGIFPAYSTFAIYRKYRCMKDYCGILHRCQLFAEWLTKYLPPFLRSRVMWRLGLSSYILRKK